MIKAILVTGTPGTGKTEVAKKLAEHYDYEYVHIGDHKEYIISENDIKIVDVNKMVKFLEKKQDAQEKGMIIESHLAHYFPKNRTRTCIVLRCDPAELKNRLKQREYPEIKIKINLEAEAIALILQEALNEGHKVYELDTTHKTAGMSVNEAIDAIDSGKTANGKIDFTYYLKDKKNLRK